MSKDAVVRARVEHDLKAHAEAVFRRIGISTTQAISIFYKQVVLRKGFPFDVRIPSKTTKRTFEATDAGCDVILCKDAKDMFRKLKI